MSVEVFIMDEIGGYFLQCHGGTIQTVDLTSRQATYFY